MYEAVITNTADWSLNNRRSWSPGSRGQKSKTTVWAGLVPPGPPLLGVQTAVVSLCPHMAIPLCVCVLTSSSYKSYWIRASRMA